MIIFKYIELEGFGSIINNLRFNLNEQGLNVITARNGIGKTTIFSGLSWCLYKKTLKHKNQVSTWEHLRPKDFKGTMAKVLFTKGKVTYEVIRYEKYKLNGRKAVSYLTLLQDGKERLDLRDKADLQEEIIKILGLSFELFKNSIVFGQKMKRIIEEDGPTKKKIFDEAFEISYIQEAKENSEKERANKNIELGKVQSNIDNNKESINYLNTQIEVIGNSITNWEDNKRSNIKAKKVEIIKVKKLISNIQGLNSENEIMAVWLNNTKLEISNLEPNLLKYKKYDDLKFKLELNISQLEGELSYYKNVMDKISRTKIETTCPTCGGKLNKDEIIRAKENRSRDWNKSKSEYNSFKKRLEDLRNNELAKLEAKAKKYQEIQTKLSQLKASYLHHNSSYKAQQKSYSQQLESLNFSLKNLRAELVKLKESSNKLLEDNLSNLNKELEIKLIKENEYLKTSEILCREIDTLNWLIKEPLSNSGIKAFIFDQMLNLVNERLTHYSSELGFKINFGIDMDSANKDFYISIESGDNIVLYNDLSGGEAQLVNICIAFSIHDIISLNSSTNLLVLDECFESLDSDNVEVISNLISLKAKGKSCFIITHLKDFNPTNSNIIRLSKKNGITKIIH